jgi:hypothetical protein
MRERVSVGCCIKETVKGNKAVDKLDFKNKENIRAPVNYQ